MRHSAAALMTVLCLCLPFWTARAETITLVADIWCPYNCEPGSDRPGYMVEIAKEAFRRHGIDVAYKTMPWSRAIEDTRHGKYNAIIGAYYGDAPDFIYPEVGQGVCKFAFYVREGDPWTFTGMSSLEDRSLGVINDYSYSRELDAYIEKNGGDPARIQVVAGDNALDTNIQKLTMDRISVFVEDRQVANYMIGQQGPDGPGLRIREAGLLPDDNDSSGLIFIAFSPADPDSARYAKILADETRNLRSGGELAKILARYHLHDFAAAGGMDGAKP